jgi:hypothetical protein
MRAMLWLKDDYPQSVKFIKEDEAGHWILNVDVFSLEPIRRIMRGLPNDIKKINI